MSQENIEVVRRGYEAFARRDIDTVLAALDPAIEVRAGAGAEVMGEELYHGHAGFLKYAQAWLESWDEYQLIPEEFTDIGGHVVTVYRAVGRGKGSGIMVEDRFAHLWTIRDSKAVRLEVFTEPDQALEAAGLRE
jgi:ketosteroid isomerase-like protein